MDSIFKGLETYSKLQDNLFLKYEDVLKLHETKFNPEIGNIGDVYSVANWKEEYEDNESLNFDVNDCDTDFIKTETVDDENVFNSDNDQMYDLNDIVKVEADLYDEDEQKNEHEPTAKVVKKKTKKSLKG